MRSYTIDAENEEDFIQEYEKAKRSRLSRLNFDENEENEKISEVDEEEVFSPKKTKKISYNNEFSCIKSMKYFFALIFLAQKIRLVFYG